MDPTIEEPIIPSDLTLQVNIIGQTDSFPNGDGSGLITCSANATDAVNYEFRFGSGVTEQSDTGQIEYTYTNQGTNSNTVAFIESSCFKTSKIAFLLLSAACVFSQSRLSGRSGLLDIKFFHPKYKNQDSTKETKKRTNYAGRTWKINELEERKRE